MAYVIHVCHRRLQKKGDGGEKVSLWRDEAVLLQGMFAGGAARGRFAMEYVAHM